MVRRKDKHIRSKNGMKLGSLFDGSGTYPLAATLHAVCDAGDREY